MKLSITTKFVLLTTLLVAVTALTITTYLYGNSARILVDNALAKLTEDVRREGDRIQHRLLSLEKDVRFLADSPPVAGLMRVDKKTGLDVEGNSTAAQWKSRLSDIFLAIAQGSPDVRQVRLIDAKGNELVRVDRNEHGQLLKLRQNQLQNKLHRPYIKDSLQLKAAEVYISDISLNQEHNKFTLPHTLTLRIATPLYDQSNKLFGLLVINLDFSQQLSVIEQRYRHQNKNLYITNQTGAYISHGDPAKRFGSDLGTRYRIQEDFPELANLFAPDNKEPERTIAPTQSDGDVMVFVKVKFDPHNPARYLAIGLTQAYSDIVASATGVLQRNIWIVLLLILTGIMLAIGFAGLLTTPLRQIMFGMDRLIQENDFTLPVHSDDEIGKLATTLNQLARNVQSSQDELQALNLRLEDEVDARTKELNLNLRLISTINRAQNAFINEQDHHHAFQLMLDGLLAVTDSEYGFIAEVIREEDGTPFLRSIVLTNIAWNEETRQFYESMRDHGLEFRNLNSLFGRVMVTGQPVISNDPAADPRRCGLPEGHPPLNAFLGIPIHIGTSLIGMAGIANRLQGYDEDMLASTAPFITTCANLITTIRIRKENDMRDQELKQAHADLERTIKSSTAVFYTSKAYGDFGATFISDNIRHQLGYTPEEFLNDPGFWADHIHPDDKQRVFDQLSRVFEHGEHSHSYRFLDKQGNYRWMQDELRLTRDKDGKPLELTGFWTDITDRKLAEIQLQESEFRHRTIIDSMLDAVITIDSNGRIESFNAAAEEMFGYKTHEVLGNNIAMLMTAQHRDKHDHYINEFHQNGKNNIIGQSRELEALDRYGRVFPISLSVNEMRIADEIFYTGVIRDISLDKQAEQALQESEEKFRSIISASPMGVFIYELNEQSELIFSGYNPAADHILGVDCNRFLGKTIEDAFPALGQTEIPKYYRRAARDGISWQTEDLHYDDKQNITGAFNVYAFQTSPGKIAVMFSDVTERLRVQEELMRFKTTLDMTNDCVLMFYPDSLELFYVNQGTIQQSGYEYAELMGLTPGRLFPILTTAEIRKLLTPLESQDKGSVIVETTMQPKTGEQMEVELHLQYIHPSGEAARYVGIMRDITERKKVERLKNEFISTVSHELRTPLTSIRGALSLIQSGTVGKLTQKTRKMVDIASNNTERLLLLINDILDIQKIETGNLSFRFRPTQVMSLVEKAMRDNAAYGHQFNVEFKLTHRLDNIYILADEDRMMQVLNNLMSNAVKFSQPGDVVELAVARHEDAVRISVTDFGSGIPESFHDKVFDRFTQSDSSDARKKGGTGLGLSIAKAIVEKHGGLINFISHANVGTTMFFDMPFIKSHSDEDDSALPEYLSEHSPCLLIIEHDVDIALLLQRMLAEAGYNSTIAQDAATAEKLLACNNFKAITLDIDLLDAEGLDFFHRLRSHEVTRHIPVVAVSAAVDENRKKLNGGAIGIIDWINKPIDEQRLINAVKTAGYRAGPPTILHVEDEDDIHQIVKTMLQDKAQLVRGKTLAEGKKLLKTGRFDLVLLDISLPDGSGLALLPLLEDITPTPGLIIFSSHDSDSVPANYADAFISKKNATYEKLLQTIADTLQAGKQIDSP